MSESLPIENREIRGITFKSMIAVSMCYGSIILSIYGTYNSLKSEIKDVRVSKDADSRINELKWKALEQKVDYQKIEFEEFKKYYYEVNKPK